MGFDYNRICDHDHSFEEDIVKVGLFPIDSKYHNLALMKLSAWQDYDRRTDNQ